MLSVSLPPKKAALASRTDAREVRRGVTTGASTPSPREVQRLPLLIEDEMKTNSLNSRAHPPQVIALSVPRCYARIGLSGRFPPVVRYMASSRPCGIRPVVLS